MEQQSLFRARGCRNKSKPPPSLCQSNEWEYRDCTCKQHSPVKNCWRPHTRDEVILQQDTACCQGTKQALDCPPHPQQCWELLSHSIHPTKESSPPSYLLHRFAALLIANKTTFSVGTLLKLQDDITAHMAHTQDAEREKIKPNLPSAWQKAL